MHSCPHCGQACDCIGDDTWDDTESAHCQHDCEPMYEDDGWGDIDSDYDYE